MGPFGPDVPVVVGHRGAPLRARENTPEAFAAAARAGATWVELDARRCADGLVVHHDPVTRDGVPLVGRTVAELDALGVWELGAVLVGLAPGLGVDVEVKNLPGEPDYDEDQAVAALVAPLLDQTATRRPLCVTSFNPATVAALGEFAPQVARGLLSGPTLRPPAALEVAREVGASILCPHVDASDLEGSIPALRDQGFAVLIWTVDDPHRARTLAAAGADAICTNDPATIATALGPGRHALDGHAARPT